MFDFSGKRHGRFSNSALHEKRDLFLILALNLFLGSCAYQPQDKIPTKADFQGYWEIKKANSTVYSVNDIFEVHDDTVSQYHFDSTTDSSMILIYGARYIQKNVYYVTWSTDPVYCNTTTLDPTHYFRLDMSNGHLELMSLTTATATFDKFTGTFPKAEWPWPPTMVTHWRI